ncbi:Nicotianamine synthase protein-domain-containing protein [Lophiotrema nucula]|uniref:Nicotianamine synthase protein-domain-containing protein n=1 Tax=Lophiotrema nucula TaxID=690887 RepID=A0A6A5ZJE1_9PLEO|nr:Nicotianamine synthase protein-domain-containing protein [Lophiotrema nucula]
MPFFKPAPWTLRESCDSKNTHKPIIMESNTMPTVGKSQTPFPISTTPPATPTVMASKAHELINEIRTIYTTLNTLSDLSPTPVVNANLSRLVELCIKPYSKDLISHVLSIPGFEPLCIQLRHLCSTAEGLLETHWAERLNSATLANPASPSERELHLRNFIYYQNYLDLTRIECATLEAFLHTPKPTPRNICFIGSGPLPLTSFCILDRYPDAHVHNIDRDQSALSLSEQLAAKLGYIARMTFSGEDVSTMSSKSKDSTAWSDFDVVFLAALVGMDTSSKLAILESLAKRLKPGTLVVVRSAHGLRSVLYPVSHLISSKMRRERELMWR